MPPDAASFPRDADILIEMIAGLRAENDKLRAMLETLKRAFYGARSERRDTEEAQLALGLGDLSAVPVEPGPDTATDGETDRPKPKRPKASRNIGGLPNHLPREDVVIEPACDVCPCCQGQLHPIGEDVTEMLDIVPAIVRVRRIRRPKYGCRACETAVVQAPAPPRPIDGGLPTAALLAHIAVSKFAWHRVSRTHQQRCGCGAV